MLLEITGVSKHFPGVRALHDVTFNVLAGEVHGLVGENGAGKSTLMGVASGALIADKGQVLINGTEMRGDPELARELGLAIVRQEPALMPDLTVAENLHMGLPARLRPSLGDVNKWAKGVLARWRSAELSFEVTDIVATLNPEQRFIVEIVKALAAEPRVLVLDEPTEHLAAEDVDRLFARIREVTARGAAVVYISHRIREVQQIANRLTVLRDGEAQGTHDAATMSEDHIVELIVGQSLDRTFPLKAGTGEGSVVLSVSNLSGKGYSDVTLELRKGEICGLAGIDANGQREFMRALAGLNSSDGRIGINGRFARITSPKSAMRAGISYLPGDRHREGIFPDLAVRENFSSRSPGMDLVGGFVRLSNEQQRTQAAIRKYEVKTPSTETPIRSLSGGNQQKIVLASVLASKPSVLLVDEPTQGVDVGARAEIYKVLREVAAQGVAILLLSSDAQEVAGMSDRVAIFSRGRIVQTLEGDEVSENAITSAVLKVTSVRDHAHLKMSPFLTWSAGQTSPLVMVALAILILSTCVSIYNPFYLSARSLTGMMTLVGTLALVAYGQQLVMMIGGIDLSVGPAMGLAQVAASFFLVQDMPAEWQATGWVMVFVVVLSIGLINWILVDPLELHPMVATLATFMAVQAVSLQLRPMPDGMIDGQIMARLGTKLGIFPISFLVAVAVALALEFLLYRSVLGVGLRGFGSRPEAARMAGVHPRRTRLLAYLGCSALAGCAAITMMQQVGIGDPRAGLGYTLGSIAAVVIGGASLFGGRGSFVGALLGAVFITQVNAVTAFLGLDQAWQSYLLGTMIIAAVALYSKSRQLAVAA